MNSTAKTLYLKIDSSKCQGHNRCYMICPELIDVDDFGIAQALSNAAIPTELLEKAKLAAANCPEYAITLEESNRLND